MKISKRVGRMALDALGTAPEEWKYVLGDSAERLGWGYAGEDETYYDWDELEHGGLHADLVLCLIASIAGVKP